MFIFYSLYYEVTLPTYMFIWAPQILDDAEREKNQFHNLWLKLENSSHSPCGYVSEV